MVASPEIARINGRKSRGPVTERGRALAAKNATRHGLLSQKPPLLVTEDLETFQSIVQGLIDEHQPQGATEHLLIQQVAMGWLRLHRLWGVEAALANQAVLLKERTSQYPARRHSNEETLLELSHGSKTNFHPDILKAEQKLVQYLLSETENFTSQLPRRNPRRWESVSELIGLFKNSLGLVVNEYPGKQVPLTNEFSTETTFLKELRRIKAAEEQAGSLWWKTSEMKERWLGFRNVGTYHQKCLELVSACDERLARIDEILSEIETDEKKIASTTLQTLAIPFDCERLARYERHIARSMHDALDRLSSIQQQRQNETSIGSFGQSAGTGT